MESLLFAVSILSLSILLLTVVIKRFKQPYIIAYLATGLLLGPHMSGLFTDAGQIEAVGQLGILLLMFFLGMELEVPDNKSLLVLPVQIQVSRIVISFIAAWLAGLLLHRSLTLVLLFTVILTFNSTAVVSEYLREKHELHTVTGKLVLNTLLLQDVLVAPALILLQFTGHAPVNFFRLMVAILGAITIIFLLRAIRNRNLYQLPAIRLMEKDHELQVFAGATICFGFATLAFILGLTAAIGSFAAGAFIGRTKALHWLGQALRPFKVFFTALFFVSAGITLDLVFLKEHWWQVSAATIIIMLFNTVLSAAALQGSGLRFGQRLYGGALLSQSGEFGLLVLAYASRSGIIDGQLYKMGISSILLSLLLSPSWINLVRNKQHECCKVRRHSQNDRLRSAKDCKNGLSSIYAVKKDGYTFDIE